ncbi:MAG: PLDc N-terminal domain-containing protein [Clostridia bacterium]|nr:PLDc N-terminal domain-containing protein [Clostridia bacterium]
MKIIKILFNRFTIISVTIILQIGLYFFLVFNLSAYWFFLALTSAISVITFIRVVNRDINPAQQLLWISVIALLPLFGITLYFLLGDSKWTRKAKRRIIETFFKQAPSVNATENVPEKYSGQANYLRNKAGTCAYRGCATEYFSSGEKYFKSLLDDLEKAEKYIFMEFFVIGRGKMWDPIEEILVKKATAGVEVTIMYDDIGSIRKLPANFYKKLRKRGLNCVKFNRYTPFVTNLHNNRDHRKIVVIDGTTAYTGGINLADEYINEDGRSYYWKDSGVRIYGNAVGELAEQFMQLFGFNSHVRLDFDKYICKSEINTGEDGVVIPFGTGPAFFYHCPLAEESLLNMINQASREIIVTTPYLIADYSLNRALVSAVARGVIVKVAIPDVPDKKTVYLLTKNNALYLHKNGVRIYRAKGSFLHAKSIVADGEVAIVGTINFDFRSFIHHFENAVWMCNTNAVKGLLEDVSAVCAEENLCGDDLDMNLGKRLVANMLKIFAPLF